MKKLLLVLLMPLLMNGQETPKSEIVNPAGKWFFGAEFGTNTITSYSLGEPNKSFQAGILAEFYTGRHWSLTGRVKYFDVGLSEVTKGHGGGSGFLSFGQSSNAAFFRGKVLTIPLNIKWEFRVWKNIAANINYGINYNNEIESFYIYTNEADYQRYTEKKYFSYNFGSGLNYFINKKSAVFFNFEVYIGGQRGRTQSLVFSSPINNTNTLLNFGYKYSFKN